MQRSEASDISRHLIRCILADVRLQWNYKDLPIKIGPILAGSILLILVFWAQNGFQIDLSHFLFLFSNYFIWILLLPQLNQLVAFLFSSKSNKWWMVGGWVLILITGQWVISNLVLSLIKWLMLAQSPIQDLKSISSYLVPSLITRLIDLLLFGGILSWLHQQRKLAHHQVELVNRERLLEQSKLQSLKSQLNPHFLFNALHTINAQIGYNDDKARELTLKFSDLLRKLLAINEQPSHTLHEEIDFLKLYLAIESERFSDRLTIKFSIDNETLKYIVPTMTLQPLIENAFKHGISQIENSTILDVVIKKQVNQLLFLVKNECPKLRKDSKRVGIGLKNLKDRLRLFYGDDISMETIDLEQTFTVKLSLPL